MIKASSENIPPINGRQKMAGMRNAQKLLEQKYPVEYRELLVQQARSGQSVRALAQESGVPEQVLRKWLKAVCLRVQVWSGCALVIADAVDRFSAQWGLYSSKSTVYPIHRLLEEVIDPALQEYADQLPAEHLGLVVGFPGLRTKDGLGKLVRTCGFNVTERSIREALRRFLKLSGQPSERDEIFVATMETLIEMIVCCASKRPRKSKARDELHLNANRQGGSLCELCGKRTELGTYLHNGSWPEAWPGLGDDDVNKLRLSHRYCSEHRPMMGRMWDASYKCAIRSKAKFEVEVVRLGKLSGARSFPSAKTGSGLADQYIWNYARHHNLYCNEHSAIREHARRMVESKFTDKKKQILMLKAQGLNQSEVALELKTTRQAVSKALKSIPNEYLEFGVISPLAAS